jgi:hypothetical protein
VRSRLVTRRKIIPWPLACEHHRGAAKLWRDFAHAFTDPYSQVQSFSLRGISKSHILDPAGIANAVMSMSNFQGGPANPTGPSGPADPLGALVSALRDSWILGIAAAEKMLSHGVGAPPSDPGASPSDVGKQVEMISLVAQSYLIAATSGMRYLSRVAQTYSSHQSNILSSFLGTGASKQLSEEDRRAVAENIRAYLR